MKQSLFIACWLCLFGMPSTVWAQETTFFIENFDTVTPPDLPAGWNGTDGRWETSSSVSSSGSGLNNIKIAGGSPGVIQTAIVDLSGMTTGTLRYLARRTSTYEQDSLVVRASVNGGTSFALTILDMGLALPSADGAYEEISVGLPVELMGVADAIFMFEALGGSTSGSNIRIDDVEVIGEGDAGTMSNIFGFSSASSTVDTGTGMFEVPVFLDFSNAASLQGIQMEVSWDAGSFDLADVIRGAAITSTTDWQINFESREGELRVVLLGNATTALPTGLYDPLFTLQFTVDAGNTADEAMLTLDRIVGALSVRTGDDAGLTTGLDTHTVIFSSGEAVFSADASSIDFATVAVDVQGESTLNVENTGTADLVISDVASSNGLFDGTPSSIILAPGATQAFTVTFAPTFEQFGYQSGELSFSHNGAGGSDVILLSATGVGGRGDATADGLVDVVDLVAGIDYVLERETPSVIQLASLDVFPYAAPDALLDVRDLTVMAQAIVLGMWPDDSPLPVLPPSKSGVGKSEQNQEASIHLEPVVEDGQVKLYLNIQIPIRAFQVMIQGIEDRPVGAFAEVMRNNGVHAIMHHKVDEHGLNMIGVDLNGETIKPGRYLLSTWDMVEYQSDLALAYALAVDGAGNKEPIALNEMVLSSTEALAEESNFFFGSPYPNPYEGGMGEGISVPVQMSKPQHVRIEVFDVLGRKVKELANIIIGTGAHRFIWKGTDVNSIPVAPGLYFIKVGSETVQQTRVVMVR